MKIEGVLFDLDGTLLDTEKLSDKAIFFALRHCLQQQPQYQFESFGPSYNILPWELKKQLLGLRGSEWAPIVLQYCIDVWNIPKDILPTVNELWKQWEIFLNQFCETDMEFCNGAAELIELLSSYNIPMAIATSSRYKSVQTKINCIERKVGGPKKNPFQYIKTIIAGDHPAVINGKPFPDIYIQAAKELNVNIKNCIVFEDALSGIRSGISSNCYAVIAIPDSRYSTEEKQIFINEATIVLNDLWEFNGTQFNGLENIKMSQLLLRKQQQNSSK